MPRSLGVYFRRYPPPRRSIILVAALYLAQDLRQLSADAHSLLLMNWSVVRNRTLALFTQSFHEVFSRGE